VFRFAVFATRVLNRAAMTAASAPLLSGLLYSSALPSAGLLVLDGARG
jgi:hypothetical protein